MATERRAYLGIDAGTSGCKGVLLTRSQRLVHSATATYPTRRAVTGEVSQDSDDWLRAVVAVGRSCADAAQQHGYVVSAVGLTAPAHNVVLVDAEGEPLGRVILWADARPSEIARELAATHGAFIFERTFVRLDASWSLAQLAWLHRESPDMWPRIRHVLPAKDYLRYRLSAGIAVSDPSDAAGTAMFDPVKGEWVEELCSEAKLRPDQLPTVRPASAVGGHLNRQMARRMHLPAGVPIAVGATDTAAELVSLGAVVPGRSLVKIASTGTVVTVSDQPRPRNTLLTYPHPAPGLWYSLAATNTAATAYQWLRETVFARSNARPATVYAEMDRMASKVPAGCDGVMFLPFLDGERTPFWDRRMTAAFLGISSAHRREHLCRAVLEGVALSLRHCRDEVVNAGLRVDEPLLGGGGIASRLWRQILVAALGCRAFLASPQGPAVGAALMATASERSTNQQAAPLVSGRPRLRPVEPNRDWTDVYDQLARTYVTAAKSLQDLPARSRSY